jgi:serine/threonine-protein kinase
LALDKYIEQGTEATVPQPTTSPSVRQSEDEEETPLADAAGLTRSETLATASEETAIDTNPDWLLWLLLGIAAVAVLGLIPLWLRVYQAYNPAATPVPTVAITPTATPAGEMVSVPNFVGLNVSDAEQLARGYELQLNVASEEKTTDALPGTILEQTPGAGARVPISTTVAVVKAIGEAFELQDVVGYQLEDVREPLEAQGLIVEIEETWSTEPAGRVLNQTPPPQTEIQAGETLTLTVSGGTDVRVVLQVNLGDRITLEEANVPKNTFRPEDSVPVTLYWRALQPLDRAYTVFVHLIPQGQTTPVAQDDSEPGNGTNPTTTWEPGEIVIDPHQVRIPPGTPAGVYGIRVGMYTAEGRLPVVDAGETEAQGDSIFIANVEVAP